MILPKRIHQALNHKRGFDTLFLSKFKDNDTAEKAYDAAVEDIQQFIPDFKEPYNGFDSYRSEHHKRMNGEVDVPEEVVYAVSVDMMVLFDVMLVKYKVRVKTYTETMKYINKYFPDFKPYANYQSFRISDKYKQTRDRARKIALDNQNVLKENKEAAKKELEENKKKSEKARKDRAKKLKKERNKPIK